MDNELFERIVAAILDVPELLSYRVWHDNPLDGYSVVLRGEQDVAKMIARALIRELYLPGGSGE